MPSHTTFDNLNGAAVVVTRWGLFHRWSCRGCRAFGSPTLNPKTATTAANHHASTCRARPR